MNAIRLSRLAAIAACLFVVAAFVAACGSSKSSSSSSAASSSSTASAQPTSAPKAGGSLVALESAGYSGDWPTGLDPATNVNGAANQDQMNAIFGDLWELTSAGQLSPDFATGYSFSNGGKTVTITLRPGLKFSDGTPLNAQAIVFNWKRDLATPCTCKPTNFVVKSITAPSATTVVTNLAAPDGAFVNQLQDSNFSWIASQIGRAHV